MSRNGSIFTCQKCGETLETDWEQCPACLTPTSSGSLTCPNCLAAIKENWKLCPHCKKTLSGWKTPTAHQVPTINDSTHPDKDQVFVTITGNEPMATVGFGFDLPIRKGDILGDRYQIAHSLGTGGFGVVYQVEDLVLNEQMALKVVVAGEGKAQRATEQILHEFKLRGKINDISHIVKAQDPRPCEFKGLSLVLLPMEFADGRSMRHWLAQNQDLEKRHKEGLELFKQVCLGVKAIHDAGLVHLDIKPENILLANGKAKIADFGIGRYGACQFSKNPNQLLHQGIGTPQYMSPEQFHVARQKDVGPASDIYSLGIVLFELLDDNLPFDGTPIELRDKHLSTPPLPLTGKLERWSRIVGKCLAKKPGERYLDVGRLIADLDRADQGTTLSIDVSCSECGHINPDSSSKLCGKCQASLDSLFRLCPVCSRLVRLDVKECPGCGHAVAEHYLLNDRKEQIEKLKDEAPADAIEILEMILRSDAGNYHEQAITLIKDLRQKQSQVASLIASASKTSTSNTPEQAIKAWQKVLKIIPRHKVAIEQIQKLDTYLKDFRRRWEKATHLMDEAKFQDADNILQGCIKDNPTRDDIRRILDTCRIRSQKYRDAFEQASTSMVNKLIRKAGKQIDIAMLQAPNGEEASALKEQLQKITQEMKQLIKQTQNQLGRAGFSEADKSIAKIEAKQIDDNEISSLKKKLTETKNAYTKLIKEAKSAISSHELNDAPKIIIKALELCPESSEAKDLSEQIDRALATSLIHNAQMEIKAAMFKKAGDILSQYERLFPASEEIVKTRELLKNTEVAYDKHMWQFENSKIDKNFKAALKEIEAAIEICPDSKEAKELKDRITHLKKKREEWEEQLKKKIVNAVKWLIVVLPGTVGISMLLHSSSEIGGLSAGISALGGILNYIRKTRIYTILYNWDFIKSRAKAVFFLIGLLLVVSGALSIMTVPLMALVFPVIAVVYSFKKEAKTSITMIRMNKVITWGSWLRSNLKSIYIIISLLAVVIIGTFFWGGIYRSKQKNRRLAETTPPTVPVNVDPIKPLTKNLSTEKQESESTQTRTDLAKKEIYTKQQEYGKWIKKAEGHEQKGSLDLAIVAYSKAQEYTDNSLQDKISSLEQQVAEKEKNNKIKELFVKAKANNDHKNGKVALGVLDELFKLEPNHVEAKQLYSIISDYYVLGEPKLWINKARSELDRISASGISRSIAYCNVAEVLYKAGDIPGADSILKEAEAFGNRARAVDGSSMRHMANSIILETYLKMEDVSKAKAFMSKLKYKNQARGKIVKELAQRGNSLEAMNIIKVMDENTREFAYYETSLIQAKMGDIKEAENTAEYFTNNSLKAVIFGTIASIQVKMDDLVLARRNITKAESMIAKSNVKVNTDAYLAIAKAYNELNETFKSGEAIRKAIAELNNLSRSSRERKLLAIVKFQMEIRDTEGALDTTQLYERNKTYFYSTIAKFQAKAGDISKAKATASNIIIPFLGRSEALARGQVYVEIIKSQCDMGDIVAARNTMNNISLPSDKRDDACFWMAKAMVKKNSPEVLMQWIKSLTSSGNKANAYLGIADALADRFKNDE